MFKRKYRIGIILGKFYVVCPDGKVWFEDTYNDAIARMDIHAGAIYGKMEAA